MALATRLLGRLPIGWLQLAHRRGRFLAAILGVGFANLLVFMQLGFMGALTSTVGLPYAALDADILIQAPDANTLTDGSPLPRQRMLDALAVPGVAAAAPVFMGKLEWRSADGSARSLDVMGVDPRLPSLRALEGRRDVLTLPGAAFIDRATRNVPPEVFAGLDAGTPQRFEFQGRGLTLHGSFTIGGSFSGDGWLVMSDQSFVTLFRNRSLPAPNLILVRAAPGQDVPALAARINAALPGPDAVARPIATALARDQAFQTTQRPVGIIFGMGVLMGALVGIIIVYQVLSSDVADHLREYATMKAMGYRQGFFLGIIMEQAVVLASLGFIPGSLMAYGLYALLTAVTGIDVLMPPERLLGVFAGTVVMCVASGALATRRLARADPAELF
ncbi:FtsX-like permease family protein [Roseococcus suduntuyensis]|uniref:Putative ABC transport system permease protein n=1 Tax=Roseococcus suduntuyensis TaxID=455361 RepID=A0A840A7G0_9PROT|nr:FtsX-like permease family protein [Roseococcus suduntuyensis]MBB3897057.1 putative ABC transport system permease protein [Roseococcus suduntuyensis]